MEKKFRKFNSETQELADRYGLTEEFLNAALDHIDKTYPNKLQGQPFILGCAWTCGFYKKEISAFTELLEIAQEMCEALKYTKEVLEHNGTSNGFLHKRVSKSQEKFVTFKNQAGIE